MRGYALFRILLLLCVTSMHEGSACKSDEENIDDRVNVAANCYSATITRRCAIAKFRRAFERLAYRTIRCFRNENFARERVLFYCLCPLETQEYICKRRVLERMAVSEQGRGCRAEIERRMSALEREYKNTTKSPITTTTSSRTPRRTTTKTTTATTATTPTTTTRTTTTATTTTSSTSTTISTTTTTTTPKTTTKQIISSAKPIATVASSPSPSTVPVITKTTAIVRRTTDLASTPSTADFGGATSTSRSLNISTTTGDSTDGRDKIIGAPREEKWIIKERKKLLRRTTLRLLVLSTIMTLVMTAQFIIIRRFRMELRDYFIQEVKTRPRTRRGPATVKQKPRKKRVKEVRKAKQPAKKGSREKGKLRTEIQGGTTMGPVSDKDTGTVDFYNWPGAESKSKEMASKSTSVEKVGMRGSKEGMSKEAASRMDSKEKVSKSLSKESPSKRSRTTSRESASRKERNVKGPRRKGTQKKRVRKRKSKGTTSTSPEEMTGTRSQEG